jgi:hypothetical protein
MTAEEVVKAHKLLAQRKDLKDALGDKMNYRLQRNYGSYEANWYGIPVDQPALKTLIQEELRRVEMDLRRLGVDIA